MKKKKVLIQTNYVGAKTGFARNAKALISYLWHTGKYDLVLYANGIVENHPDFKRYPWRTVGSLPNNQDELNRISRDPSLMKQANYGSFLIDKVIMEEKPDIWIGIEDIWGFPRYYDKPWYKHINTCMWTTLDSLPVIPQALEYAKKEKNFWVWASFAEKAMKAIGPEYSHVRTVHGCIDASKFNPISVEEKMELRAKFGIPKDAVVFAFVSRNQLRKQFWALLEALVQYRKQYPHDKVKLLFHTSWTEVHGWRLQRLMEELRINMNDVYTTMVCKNCGQYELSNYTGEDRDCRLCGTRGKKPSGNHPGSGQVSANILVGVTEEELARIYGVADAYIHLMTSGGLEYGIPEAMLCGLPVATVPYSCGTDFTEQSFVFPIDWTRTRECETNFVKATPNISRVVEFMHKMVMTPANKRRELGLKGREWALATFDASVIGKQLEEWIDSRPEVTWDFVLKPKQYNISYPMPTIEDDTAWLLDMYKNIMDMQDETAEGDGCKYWLGMLKNGARREDIYRTFLAIAQNENLKNQHFDFESLFDKARPNKRALFVMKESMGDIWMLTSLFDSFKKQYPDHDLYVACEPNFAHILDGDSRIHKVLRYYPQMESELFMIGAGQHKGFVDVYFHPAIGTQRCLNYLSQDKPELVLQ